jgi:hypothetical protein
VRGAEEVGVFGVVKARSHFIRATVRVLLPSKHRSYSPQRWTNQIKGCPNQIFLLRECCHLLEGNDPDFFIGPTDAEANGYGCIGWVVFQQFFLSVFDVTGAEVEAQTGLMGG